MGQIYRQFRPKERLDRAVSNAKKALAADEGIEVLEHKDCGHLVVICHICGYEAKKAYALIDSAVRAAERHSHKHPGGWLPSDLEKQVT